MHNIKTTKIHTFRAHLDRMENTAEWLAVLGAGEAMDGRLSNAAECSRLCVGLKAIMAQIQVLMTNTRGQEPTDN